MAFSGAPGLDHGLSETSLFAALRGTEANPLPLNKK